MHVVSAVTPTGSDVSVSNTAAEAAEEEFTLNSNLTYPFSLHEIPQSIKTIQTTRQHETNELSFWLKREPKTTLGRFFLRT